MNMSNNFIKKANLCQVDIDDIRHRMTNMPRASSRLKDMEHDVSFLRGKAEAFREAAQMTKGVVS